ncbi:Hint domain-containing protein [Ancylobacter oerskovii]|uniref:Hint domain-containing protein n=1 Tax=Ancylobacter oerskovii TaxID=459519 RepID=A0ABW4YTU2_9HYPH|nr:Hint domain-containing protein [Ancylobacter oerskovii]MBS7543308.1 Hint domain-containing protein [Ancylobacter oerskovii]
MADYNSSSDGQIINGTEASDSFSNAVYDPDINNNVSYNNVVFNGMGGNDVFVNGYGSGVAFSGGDGDDTLYAGGTGGTYNGDAGNDTIDAGISVDSVVSGGEGSDTIFANGSTNGTFNGGDDNDTFNFGNSTGGTFDGGTGDDTFNLSAGESATIIGGDGNDRVYLNDINQYGIEKNDGTVTLTRIADGDVTVVSGVETFIFAGTEYSLEDLPCFLPGTLVRTPDGDRPIEQLVAGDLVVTFDGEVKAISWMGRKTVSASSFDPLRVYPIRIQAGALGDNLPARDLFVSPDHAVLIDGMLVQAGALVNGDNITRHLGMPEEFTYHHVMLDDHSLIVTENVPTETFIDHVTITTFDNWQECPETAGGLVELDYPRAKSWRQVPRRVHEQIARRAAGAAEADSRQDAALVAA